MTIEEEKKHSLISSYILKMLKKILCIPHDFICLQKWQKAWKE